MFISMYAKYTTFARKNNLKLPQESNFGSTHLLITDILMHMSQFPTMHRKIAKEKKKDLHYVMFEVTILHIHIRQVCE